MFFASYFSIFFMPGFIFLTDQSTMSLLNLWESKQSSCFRAVVRLVNISNYLSYDWMVKDE